MNIHNLVFILQPGFFRLVEDNDLERAEAFTEDYLKSEIMYTDSEIDRIITGLRWSFLLDKKGWWEPLPTHVRMRDDVQ